MKNHTADNRQSYHHLFFYLIIYKFANEFKPMLLPNFKFIIPISLARRNTTDYIHVAHVKKAQLVYRTINSIEIPQTEITLT